MTCLKDHEEYENFLLKVEDLIDKQPTSEIEKNLLKKMVINHWVETINDIKKNLKIKGSE